MWAWRRRSACAPSASRSRASSARCSPSASRPRARRSWTSRSTAASRRCCDQDGRRVGGRGAPGRRRPPRLRHPRRPQSGDLRRAPAAVGDHPRPGAPRGGRRVHGGRLRARVGRGRRDRGDDGARRDERPHPPRGVVRGVAAGGETALQALARRLDAPVLTTVMGRGAISERDALWHAVLPNRRASEPVLKAADVVVAIGCRFAHRSTQGLLLNLAFGPGQTLIHLDLDPTVIGALFKPQLSIVGDAKDGLARLLAELGADSAGGSWDHGWRSGLSAAASPRYTVETARLIQTLRSALPDDAIVVNDQTGINYWMEWRFPVLAPRTFLYPVGSATRSYGVPAAIGAKIARPERPVICVVGDGGFMYSANELATAVKYRLPIV